MREGELNQPVKTRKATKCVAFREVIPLRRGLRLERF